MRHTLSTRLQGCALLVAVLCAASVTPAVAQPNSLDDARSLYFAAAYEEALAILSSVQPVGAAEAADVEGYRAASLLALGRFDDADRAFERLVELAPATTPEQLNFAPWIAARFALVRARLQPQLRRPQEPARGVRPEETALYTIHDAGVTRPVALDEVVPEPPPPSRTRQPALVLLQVDIGADGGVEQVTLEGSASAGWESVLRSAASQWKYHPATLDGRPVRFRKALRIELR